MNLDQLPRLTGRRILVTRALDRSAELRRILASLGADVVACPLVRTEPIPATAPPPDLTRFDWLVLTSPNAVRYLRDCLAADRSPTGSAALGRDADLLPPGLRLAVVGPGTAQAARELLRREAALCPATATGDDLARALGSLAGASGLRVLRVRGDLAGEQIEAAMRNRGAVVEVWTLYRTVGVAPPPDVVQLVQQSAVSAVTFASGSAVDAFEAGFTGHRLYASAPAACLGPVTAARAAVRGWCRVVTAAEPTDAGLAAVLAETLGPGSSATETPA
ncbi:MAG: uroporphyrinogen-III synthase [Candidatus Krumholzibacteria bacterium]|jgi:uroporphyrinogen-III synthase|nr:uroporphyrinogen-III synthase [Candidatus Krumholzibacteria bacterium]